MRSFFLQFAVFIFLICGGFQSAVAQVWLSPPTYPETVFPSGTPPVFDPTHTSAHSAGLQLFTGSPPLNNLYVYAWVNGLNDYSGGIAWYRMTAADVPVNWGYIPTIQRNHMNVGILESEGLYYVIASYYFEPTYIGGTAGFYYDIYSWGAGGLAALSLLNPVFITTGSTTLSPINMDVFENRDVALTWGADDRIYVKAMRVTPGGIMDEGINVNAEHPDMATGIIPDVALSRPGSGPLQARVAFQSDGDIYVMHEDYNFLHASPPPVWTCVSDGSYASGTDVRVISLDCPDIYTDDNWALSYMKVLSPSVYEIHGLIYTDPAIYTPYISDLLSAGDNKFPVTAYHESGERIYFGFHHSDFPVAYGNVIATYQDNGTRVTFLGTLYDYRQISGAYINPVVHPTLAFSKQNIGITKLLAVYPYYDGVIYDMRFKLVPWMAPGSLKQEGRLPESPGTDFSVQVYPNPLAHGNLNLSLAGVQPAEILELRLCDVLGKVVYADRGRFGDLNIPLAQHSRGLLPGHYFLQVSRTETGEEQVVSFSKL